MPPELPREGHGPVHDIHAHHVSGAVEALVADEPGRIEELVTQGAHLGAESLAVNRTTVAELGARLTDLDTRLAAMDRAGVDVQVVSASPSQYYYWAAPDLAEAVVAAANADLAALVARAPGRLAGLGSVALQHPGLAADQVRAAVVDHGLAGVMISTAAGGRELSDIDLEPLWAAAEDVGAAVLIHPNGCSLGERLNQWYLSNIVGLLTETAVALSHLIFSGVFDRHPLLRVCASYGGAYLPASIGRSDHGWAVRPEARTCAHPPSSYLSRLWYDSVVHDPVAVRALIDRVGASQILLGSDYPFDMGVDDPLAALDETPALTPGERAAITSGNFAGFLGRP